MIINTDQKQMQMEQRDVNYILPAYIRNYLFQSKNIDPVEIVFPMFSSVPHPRKPGVTIPIRWVPEISPEAIEIAVDGAGVAEATEEEIAVKDEADDMRKEAKEAIESTSVTKGPPSGPILPPGTPLDNMAPRDRGDQIRVAKDLRPEPDVDESKEVEAVIEKPKEK